MIALAPMKHTTLIRPLYGLCYQEGIGQWVSESPFNGGSPPIKLSRWLSQPVIQIDCDRYDMGQALSEIANTQGAHSDHQKDTIRQRIRRNFCGVYLNIFALRVGVYLVQPIRRIYRGQLFTQEAHR